LVTNVIVGMGSGMDCAGPALLTGTVGLDCKLERIGLGHSGRNAWMESGMPSALSVVGGVQNDHPYVDHPPWSWSWLEEVFRRVPSARSRLGASGGGAAGRRGSVDRRRGVARCPHAGIRCCERVVVSGSCVLRVDSCRCSVASWLNVVVSSWMAGGVSRRTRCRVTFVRRCRTRTIVCTNVTRVDRRVGWRATTCWTNYESTSVQCTAFRLCAAAENQPGHTEDARKGARSCGHQGRDDMLA
jgi:hypothetical protein